jgi:hypothetical protein
MRFEAKPDSGEMLDHGPREVSEGQAARDVSGWRESAGTGWNSLKGG